MLRPSSASLVEGLRACNKLRPSSVRFVRLRHTGVCQSSARLVEGVRACVKLRPSSARFVEGTRASVRQCKRTQTCV